MTVAQSIARPITVRTATAVASQGLGGSSLALPSGAIGAWYASDYQSSPRAYIPNRMASGGTPVNLWNGTKRLLNNASFWPTKTNVTVTDEAVTGPSGQTDAATIVSSSSSWLFGTYITNLPAGTYTIACYAKRNTGTDQTFKFNEPTSTSGVKTATDTWQRFSHTFTFSGGAVSNIGLLHNSSNASLQVTDLELFSGSSDLGPEPDLVGTLFFDSGRYNQLHAYSSGILDLSPLASFGLIQLPTAISVTSVSVVAVARKKAASSGYVCALSKVQNWNHFDAAIEDANVPQLKVGGSSIFTGGTNSAAWELLNKGWSSFGWRVDGNSRDFWIDFGKTLQSTTTSSANTMRDLFVSTIIGAGYGQGYEWAAIALYDRALTDEEMITAQQALMDECGVERGGKRILIAAGDSISNGGSSYPTLFLANDSPAVMFYLYTVVGGTMSQVASLIEDVIPPSIPSGGKYIVSFMVTNVASYDAPAYIAELQALCDGLRTRGAIVVLCTLLPRSSSTHNTWRNAVNAAIYTWVGTHCDAICDFAADPTIGTDAAGSNTTYYPDGVHPTNAVHSTYLEPIYRTTINAL